MNDEKLDPEVEAMLNELAPTPEERARLLEEHRQLEKDLLRLQDPLPPHDFVQQVMAKIRTAPAPALSRSDVMVFVGILGAGIAATGYFTFAQGAEGLGLSLARAVVTAKELLVGISSGLSAIWNTAALPFSVGLSATLMTCLVALKRAMSGETSEVAS